MSSAEEKGGNVLGESPASMKFTEQDSGPESGEAGITGETPRGCLVSLAVHLAECWMWGDGKRREGRLG